MVADYICSCTSCTRAKPKHHKPYGMLQQLPIPECPWNLISMDFIEHLPKSDGFTVILIMVDHLTKQSIFIPTYNTVTSADLACYSYSLDQTQAE